VSFRDIVRNRRYRRIETLFFRLAAELDISQEHLRHFIDGSASPIDSVLLGAVDIAIADLEALNRDFPSWRELVLQPRFATRQ